MIKKHDKLRKDLATFGKVLIAFSGGVDSTFLLLSAVESLGAENVTAIMCSSEFLKVNELQEAEETAAALGVQLHTVHLDLLADPLVAANPVDRCYHCKKRIFTEVTKLAKQLQISHVLEGSNADDINDYRPGMRALCELGIKSPLLVAGLTKNEIRYFLHARGNRAASKPSTACLASRIPYNTQLDRAALMRVDKAEAIIMELGLGNTRVRDHYPVARIEVAKDIIPLFVKKLHSDQTIEKLKLLGYSYITVDLDGYRTGSLNEKALQDE